MDIKIKSTIENLVSHYIPQMINNYVDKLLFEVLDDKAKIKFYFTLTRYERGNDDMLTLSFVDNEEYDVDAQYAFKTLTIKYESGIIQPILKKVVSFIERETNDNYNKISDFNKDTTILVNIDNVEDFFDNDDTIIIDEMRIVHD